MFRELDKEQAQFLLVLIGQKIEHLVLMIVNNLFDGWNLVQFIKVHKFIRFAVIV
jgi:hypothetical protein